MAFDLTPRNHLPRPGWAEIWHLIYKTFTEYADEEVA
jgi:hypothetical protein